ncbi:hypothetical protein Syun_020783 [Stephania yunnanensis]|uniref:Uncharacterized protein n=1 Tax=Stephania yunnanensis TaxID=152371 RepID=A0AAP0IFR7_9MAGN
MSLSRDKSAIDVYNRLGLSSSSLQTLFIDQKCQDLRRRTVAEDPPPPRSPSSSTAIVDVDHDSPTQSFIRDRESPRAPAQSTVRRRRRCAVFSSSAAEAARSSPLVSLFIIVAASFFGFAATAPYAAVIRQLRDPLCRLRWSPPRSSAAAARRVVSSAILRHRWLSPAPPLPPLLDLTPP